MIKIKDYSVAGLKEKTLLILTSSYPNEDESYIGGSFVKYQVAELKQYFKKIIIISTVLRSFGYSKKDKLCKDYSYDNVDVNFPRCFYIPIFWSSKILIDNRLHVVERYIEEHHLDFDLIHAHFTWPSGYIGVRLKEKYKKPVITTVHENCDWFEQEISMDHPLIKAAWSGADGLIRVNRKDVPALQRYNKQVYAIPNGFSQAFYHIDIGAARRRLRLSGDTKIIFTLGNLIKRKGFNYLIDAMEQICHKRGDAICYIGGGGPERESLQGQIDRLHIGEKVRLIGSVPGNQLNLWMNACDLFVLPSLNEGNPAVMFEALGCGKPVVGTKVGGVPEVIISEDYGLLVDPANSEDLTEKILQVLDQESNRERILSYAGQFAWENIAKEIVGVYMQVLRLNLK